MHTALRVSAIPPAEFEALVEAEEPPTVTELARRGTKHHPPLVDLKGRDPADFHAATRSLGMFRAFVEFAHEIDTAVVLRRLAARERRRRARRDGRLGVRLCSPLYHAGLGTSSDACACHRHAPDPRDHPTIRAAECRFSCGRGAEPGTGTIQCRK